MLYSYCAFGLCCCRYEFVRASLHAAVTPSRFHLYRTPPKQKVLPSARKPIAATSAPKLPTSAPGLPTSAPNLPKLRRDSLGATELLSAMARARLVCNKFLLHCALLLSSSAVAVRARWLQQLPWRIVSGTRVQAWGH